MSKKYSKKTKKVVHKDHYDNIMVKNNKNLEKPVLELPELNMMPVYHTKRRFTASAAVNGTITVYQLFEQFRFAISATTAYIYIRAVRIKRIRLLASVATSGTPVTASIQPSVISDATSNCFNSLPSVYTDTSSNLSVPCFVDVSPSEMTPLGSWHTNQLVNNTIATIVAPSGAIMDLDLEFVLNLTGASTYTSTSSGMTAGLLYAGNMITNFAPVSVNAI